MEFEKNKIKINDYHLYKALILKDNGEFEKSKIELNEYINKGGNITEEIKVLTKDIDNITKYEKAIEMLNEVPEKSLQLLLELVEEFDSNPLIYYYIGVAFRRLQKFEEAIHYLRESIKIESGILEVVVELGLNYACLGEYEEALIYFKKAFEASRDVEICTNIIMCYINLKDMKNAKLHLAIAKELNSEDEIVKEIENLKKEGYLEITLLGQNVNAYGKDLEEEYNFASLLEDVAKTGIPRIRFVTSHPWDFTDEMIDVIQKYENIMPYIHLPLQSGSSRILKLMGRRYTKEEYLTLYKKIKEKIKNVSITTDIIVGFPNETKEDFKETLEVVKECKFDGAFTFIYSPREGTPASKIKDNISKEEKEKRLQELNNLINADSLSHNKEYIGKIEEVLVLGPSEKGKDKVYGYTKTMKLVNINDATQDIGKIIPVEITDAKSFSLDGKKAIFIKN